MSDQESQVVVLLKKDNVQKRFADLLGSRAPQFISSLLQVVKGSDLLLKADPESIMNAAATAAMLNLPINQSLGLAWIVPYKGKGQFQMGWKGFVQLAMRTGQYEKLNVVEVYENQFTSFNVLTEELIADFLKDPEGKVVGYVGYFRLKTGFVKTVYWSRKKVDVHAKKYSQSYKKGFGVWADGEDGFTAMAKKTVLKLMLSQWGIMTIEMQTAQVADQGILDGNGHPIEFPDNRPPTQEEKDEEAVTNRLLEFIEAANSLDELEMVKDESPHEFSETVQKFYNAREKQLQTTITK